MDAIAHPQADMSFPTLLSAEADGARQSHGVRPSSAPTAVASSSQPAGHPSRQSVEMDDVSLPTTPLNQPRPLEAPILDAAAAETVDDTVQAGSSSSAVDKLLLDGLGTAKDRLLLLRADLEIERFVADPSATRLRLAPPAFPPALNSYQRLLLHRLSDLWHISRELESSSQAPGSSSRQSGLAQTMSSTAGLNTQASNSAIPGTIVLVKRHDTQVPLVRMAKLAEGVTDPTDKLVADIDAMSIQRKDPTDTVQKQIDDIVAKATLSQPPEHQTPTARNPNGEASQSSFQIMSRAQRTRNLNDDRSARDGAAAEAGLKAKSLQEREAAYAQARERIFGPGQEGGPSNPSEHATVPLPLYAPVPVMGAPSLTTPRWEDSVPIMPYSTMPMMQSPPDLAPGGYMHFQPLPYPQPLTASTMLLPGSMYYSPHSPVINGISRPPSASSHVSYTSNASALTAYSASSSVRTASTSSGRPRSERSKHAYSTASRDLLPVRNTAHGSLRQSRPSLGNLSSNTSNVSVPRSMNGSMGPHSRHSHSSSSASASTSTSMSVRSVGGSTSATVGSTSVSERDSDAHSTASVSSKGKGRERDWSVQPLPEPHPSVPHRPAWLSPRVTDEADAIEASETSTDVSRGEVDAVEQIQKYINRVAADATPSPPASVSSTRAIVSAPRRASVAQPSPFPLQDKASVAKDQAQHFPGAPKIVEYPPLRYDPEKGWTAVVPLASPVGHAPPELVTPTDSPKLAVMTPSTGTIRKSPRPRQHGSRPANEAEHRAWQHIDGSPVGPQYQPSMQYAPHAGVAHYPMPVQYVHGGPAVVYSQGMPQNHAGFQPQLTFQPGHGPFVAQGQPAGPGFAMPYGHGQAYPVGEYTSATGMYGMPQPQFVYPQYMQPVSHNRPQPPHPGGLTAADMIANGEMLYSHDLPRPTPRSGATLFDPGARQQ